MRTIKKYGNRRLYDTNAKSYINLEQLAALIRDGEVVEVVDAKTGEDLSRSVLLQVVLETQGAIDILPASLLHRIIRATVDTPHHRMALKQMSMALELLERQLTTMEKQFSFSGMAGTPGRSPGAAPSPEQEASPAFANEEELDPETNDAPRHEPDEELDELRQRLRKLEKRLKTTNK